MSNCQSDGNGASQKILENLGFEHLSISPNSYKMNDGSMIGDHLYSLKPSSVLTKDQGRRTRLFRRVECGGRGRRVL